RVRPAVRRGPGDFLVDRADSRDRFAGIAGSAEGGDAQEVAGPLQPAPRVTAVPRMPGHRGHGQRMQGLQQQSRDPADEHRGIPVYPADRAVLGEPALARCVDQPPALWALRPSHPLDDYPTQAVPNQISGTQGVHPPTLPPPPPAPAPPAPPLPGRRLNRSQQNVFLQAAPEGGQRLVSFPGGGAVPAGPSRPGGRCGWKTQPTTATSYGPQRAATSARCRP